MSDMAPTIIPKSDQLNADDLLAGPRTITIREMNVDPGTEQPVKVFFNGDNGKPYLPCKSMRRVMVALWGPDASAYAGRSMTLYRDPTVTWGGMEVGGIRISHMSHIDKQAVVVLTATKKARKPFTVAPLVVEKPQEKPPQMSDDDKKAAARKAADRILVAIDQAQDENACHAVYLDDTNKKIRDRLKAAFPDMDTEIENAMKAKLNAMALAEIPA